MDEQWWPQVKETSWHEKQKINGLRFAIRVEHSMKNFENFREAMGAVFSSLRRKRQQWRANRNLKKKKLKHLQEYCLALDRELELATRHLQELLSKDIPGSSMSLSSLSNHLDSLSLCSIRDALDSSEGMAGSSKNNKTKSAVNDILVLAEERCEVLDQNIRLLEDRREEINRNIEESYERLKLIHTKAESFRFRHFVSKHPVDTWSVVSTPF